MKLIYDKEEVRKFHSILKPLVEDEVYFISLSARNKYLTPEERLEYDLGRTEMFCRKIVKTNAFEDFLRAIESYEIESGYTGRSYKTLPEKCIAVYVNENTSSGKKALQEFYKMSNEVLFTSKNPEDYRFLDTWLMNCYQKNRSYKMWIDIDIDSPDSEFSKGICAEMVEDLRLHEVKYHVVQTHSGYHILLNRETLNYNFNVKVGELDLRSKNRFQDKAEVCRNVNEMIPLPGTISGGYPVHFCKEF